MLFGMHFLTFCSLTVVSVIVPLAYVVATARPVGTMLRKQEQLSETEPDIDDLVFTNHFLWSHDVSTAGRCALECLADKGCLGFSLDTLQPEGTKRCRAHSAGAASEIMIYFPQNETAPGYRYYSFQQKAKDRMLGRPCDSASDCEKGFICFQERCYCEAGQYYSHANDSCVSVCPEIDLEASFLKYDESFFMGNIPHSFNETSLINCAVRCLQQEESGSVCRSVDMDAGRGLCFVNGQDVVGTESDFVLTSRWDATYLQRTCK